MSEQWKIVEGIAGLWHYHLARVDASDNQALCGAQTMLTHLPLETWGFRSHIRETYCDKCESIAIAEEAVND
jgi:hypothetical protein